MAVAKKPARASGTPVGGDDLRVRADDDKLFFINMLVKDIELVPAILDLADNSVDSARELRARSEIEHGDAAMDEKLKERNFAGLKVELTVDPNDFSISDNCGGIDIDIASNYAFRFGRSAQFEGTPASVGQFGVGCTGSYSTAASTSKPACSNPSDSPPAPAKRSTTFGRAYNPAILPYQR